MQRVRQTVQIRNQTILSQFLGNKNAHKSATFASKNIHMSYSSQRNYDEYQRKQQQMGFVYLLAPVALMGAIVASKQEEFPSFLSTNLFGSTLPVNECAGLNDIPRPERIRGAYENKIRFYAAPEKVFEIFATEKDDQNRLIMSYSDFLKAMTPYSYTEPVDEKETEEYLKENTPQIL